MTESEFINKFITEREIEVNRYSCLVVALGDARKLTGRDQSSGTYQLDILTSQESFLDPHSFIGLVNYLLILDMIGAVFKNPSLHPPEKHNIYNALKQFSHTSDKDINTIIALRNSLAHNYGLINIPTNIKKYPDRLHKFTLNNQASSQLIKYPSQSWNGNDYLDKSDNTATIIGYIAMVDLIESVYTNLKAKVGSGSFTLALSNIEELKSRFTIRF